MKRNEKEQVVATLQQEFMDVKSAVLLDYKGLNVAEITELRNKLRESEIDFKVIKNTLSKLAAKGTDMEKLESCFIGPTAAAISKTDPVVGIKVLNDFIKSNPKLEFKGAVVEGAYFKKEDVAKLADLPSREVLLAQFLGTLQAPVSTFVRLMSGTISGLLNILNGIKSSKEGN
ncbi:50S ribosomal protein L10 [bacterium]|nr:50S ribosomal protein L10 [candidate division CSSED10-310 bacterium]